MLGVRSGGHRSKHLPSRNMSTAPSHSTWREESTRGVQSHLRELRGSLLSSRHEELDRVARERGAVLAAVKGAHAEQLQALEARVLELQAQCEALELQVRRAEWRQADALKEKDVAIDK